MPSLITMPSSQPSPVGEAEQGQGVKGWGHDVASGLKAVASGLP
ncbi:MAG: hypothetical protein ACOYLB_12795 [Phototrophicaceae bacterium]